MATKNLANLAKHVREIRLHLCQTSSSSAGVREFIEQHYVNIKINNPKFPFLIRECSGVEPKITARYAYGVEKSVGLSQASVDEVLKTTENLCNPSS